MSQAPLVSPGSSTTINLIVEAIHGRTGQFYILAHHDAGADKYMLPSMLAISELTAYKQAAKLARQHLQAHFESRSLRLVSRLSRINRHTYRCKANSNGYTELPSITGHLDGGNLVWIAESEIGNHQWWADHHQIITVYLRTKSSGTEGF